LTDLFLQPLAEAQGWKCKSQWRNEGLSTITSMHYNTNWNWGHCWIGFHFSERWRGESRGSDQRVAVL